jgi:hypothetical protein
MPSTRALLDSVAPVPKPLTIHPSHRSGRTAHRTELRLLLGPFLAQLLSQLRNLLWQSRLFRRFRPRPSCGCPSLRSGIFSPTAFSSSFRNHAFPRAALSPTTPKGPASAFACCFFTRIFRLHPTRSTGRPRLANEAESGSLAVRLARPFAS